MFDMVLSMPVTILAGWVPVHWYWPASFQYGAADAICRPSLGWGVLSCCRELFPVRLAGGVNLLTAYNVGALAQCWLLVAADIQGLVNRAWKQLNLSQTPINYDSIFTLVSFCLR